MDEKNKPLVAFTTNSFVGNPYGIIIMGFFAGMILMSMGIMAGVPVFISMALLFGGILGVYGFGIGKVHYVITPSGIEQHIQRFIPYYLWHRKETRIFPWNAIRSYKNDTDQKRTGEEYEYLKLYLNKSPGEVWITNQHDDTGFQKFKGVFLSIVAGQTTETLHHREGIHTESPQKSTKFQTSEKQQTEEEKIQLPSVPYIKKRKSFYETFFAKLITIFFIMLTIFLVWILAYKGMHFTNWFRVLFILLPGTVYMTYRVFIQPKINKEDTRRYSK
ncbi:MAG: hypothetical protein MUE99_08010 [Chitinophagaceae bacterium]|nr:hypothetical protein [Chitinophagaceae bacterium]